MFISLTADQSVKFGKLVESYLEAVLAEQMRDPTAFVRRGYWIIPVSFLNRLDTEETSVRQAFFKWEDRYVKSLGFERRTCASLQCIGIALVRAGSDTIIEQKIEVSSSMIVVDIFSAHEWPEK